MFEPEQFVQKLGVHANWQVPLINIYGEEQLKQIFGEVTEQFIQLALHV